MIYLEPTQLLLQLESRTGQCATSVIHHDSDMVQDCIAININPPNQPRHWQFHLLNTPKYLQLPVPNRYVQYVLLLIGYCLSRSLSQLCLYLLRSAMTSEEDTTNLSQLFRLPLVSWSFHLSLMIFHYH